MKIKKIEKFISTDNVEFDTIMECNNHEAHMHFKYLKTLLDYSLDELCPAFWEEIIENIFVILPYACSYDIDTIKHTLLQAIEFSLENTDSLDWLKSIKVERG